MSQNEKISVLKRKKKQYANEKYYKVNSSCELCPTWLDSVCIWQEMAGVKETWTGADERRSVTDYQAHVRVMMA